MARSDVLVSADWAQSKLDADHVVFVEVDEDTSAYDDGHIAGAIKLDWRTDLQDPVRRDFVDKAQFEKLLSGKGVANDQTVVLLHGYSADRQVWPRFARHLLDRYQVVIPDLAGHGDIAAHRNAGHHRDDGGDHGDTG